jgi:hypothetical protein
MCSNMMVHSTRSTCGSQLDGEACVVEQVLELHVPALLAELPQEVRQLRAVGASEQEELHRLQGNIKLPWVTITVRWGLHLGSHGQQGLGP